MAIPDDTIDNLTQQDDDQLISDVQVPVLGQQESPERRDKKVVQAAFVKAETEGKHELEAYNELAVASDFKSGDEILAGEADKLTAFNEKLLAEIGIQNVDPTLDPMPQLAAVQEEVQAERDRAASIYNSSRAYVESIAGVELTQDQIDNEAVRLFIASDIQDMLEGRSTFQVGLEFVRDFTLIPEIIDNHQLTGELNPFEARDVLESMITEFRRKTPAEQIEAWGILKEELLAILPVGRVAEIAQAITDPLLDESDALNRVGFWAAADIGTTVLGFRLWSKMGEAATRPIDMAARAKNREKAAELSALGMVSDEIAAKLGVDKSELVDNAMPYGVNPSPSPVDDLSTDIQRKLIEFKEGLDKTAVDLAEGNTFLREGILDKNDRRLFVEKMEDRYAEQAKDLFDRREWILKAEKVASDSEGVTFKVTYQNSDGDIIPFYRDGEVSEFREETFKFARDDVNTFSRVDNIGPKIASSPMLRAAGSNIQELVKGAVRLDQADQKVRTQLQQSIKQIGKGLNKQQLDEVDEILLMGDDARTVYNAVELRGGISGKRLSEPQILAYYKARHVYDMLGDIRDAELRRSAVARGVRDVKLSTGKHIPGEVVSDAAAAGKRLKGTGVRYIWDDTTGTRIDVNTLTQKQLDDLYSNNKALVQLEETTGFKGTGGGIYDMVLTSRTSTRDLPMRLTNRIKGYVPRSNPNAQWFVQRFQKKLINGVERSQRKAVRSFDNEKDAKEFADAMAAAETKKTVTYAPVQDNELNNLADNTIELSHTGGLYSGARKKHKLPHGKPGTASDPDADRRSAFESLALYAENTKNVVTRNEWRMGAIQKWENTAAEMFPNVTDTSFARFNHTESGASKQLKFLNEWRDQINIWNNQSTKSEDYWEGLMQGLSEKVINSKVGRGSTSEFINRMKRYTPVNMVKAAAFHMALGTYNPIQTFVQAQGASVAASLQFFSKRPDLVLKHLKDQTALSMLQHVDVDSPAFKTMSIAMGHKPSTMKKIKQIWDKSGLFDSMRTNADMQAALKGYPVGADSMRSFFDNGLIFLPRR